MKTRRTQLTEIRDMVVSVEEFGLNSPHDLVVFEMFGSVSREMAKGLIMGLNIAIREALAVEQSE